MTAETRVSLDLVAVRQAREIFPSEQYPRKKCMEMEKIRLQDTTMFMLSEQQQPRHEMVLFGCFKNMTRAGWWVPRYHASLRPRQVQDNL